MNLNKTVSKIKQVNVNELIFYKNNARVHPDKQIEQIANSIIKFGFNNPILINSENIIIAGHGRLMAAKKIGLKTVPAIYLKHMTEDEVRAFIILDNKIASNANWDYDILSEEMDLIDMSELDIDLLGFTEHELTSLLEFNSPVFDITGVDSKINNKKYYNEEWHGMPEFNQPDKTSNRRLIVHFRSETDIKKFFNLINQSFTNKTNSIWYPVQINMDTNNRRYKCNEEP